MRPTDFITPPLLFILQVLSLISSKFSLHQNLFFINYICLFNNRRPFSEYSNIFGKQNKLFFTSNNKNSSNKRIMQRLKQKEMLEFKNEQLRIKEAYRHALDNLLRDQTLKIIIEYSKEQLKKIDVTKIQNINDYSPVSISRLIFSKQLQKIKQEIRKLPNKKCPLDHFLIIMLKVVKFPFQKIPYYLLGLEEMFIQMKNNEYDENVTFSQIETYVMGEVVNFADEAHHDTEFQIRFIQNKMQDFLIHDNGVNKIFHSHDLQKYIVLDQGSSIIKIYDQSMKIVARFQPNKEKHNKKHPTILTFDYNQFGSKLAISLSDNTFTIVHLGNFLSAPSDQLFRSVFLNEIVYKSKSMITKIYFLSMMNKWLCIGHSNDIWIYDVETYKEDDDNYCKKFKHPNIDYQISYVIQLVSLSSIAFVIYNEIWFYNQKLTDKKFKKYCHEEEINKIIFQDQKNQFYIVGKGLRNITIFSLNKTTGHPSKIWLFQTNQVIADFDIFPFHNTILILDSKNNLKVYPVDDSNFKYNQNYDFIVKKNQLPIKLVKTSKTSFLIHATYILVMELQKVAIQRDMQYTFQQTFFYDTNKEEITFSMNGQIISLSLLHGEIRKNIAPQNSNIQKHKAFYVSRSTQLFVIDQNDSLYEVLSKNDPRYKDLKDYRKKLGMSEIKRSFYDEEYKMVIMIGDSSIYFIRNDSQNNFTFKSCLLLQNFPPLIKYKYCPRAKQLLFLDATNQVYLMRAYDHSVERILKINIFKEWNEGEKIIIDLEYESQFATLMILTNTGQFAIFNINDQTQSIYIRIKDLLPYKLQNSTFTSFFYQKAEGEGKDFHPSRIFFYNQSGLLIEFSLDQMLSKIATIYRIAQKCLKVHYMKDTHEVNLTDLLQKKPLQIFTLQKSKVFNPNLKYYSFIKAHEKSIVFSKRIQLEGYHLLTIGQDGHIKLWGKDRKIYFDLKLPLMVKIQWNMNELHQKRNLRIVQQTISFLQSISDTIKKNQQKALLQSDLRKKLRNKSEKIKINFQNPIQLEFENKDLQQIVTNSRKQLDFQTMIIDSTQKEKRDEARAMSFTQRINEPWKKRKQFQQIYQKASPVDKYLHKFKEKMPFDLQLMRNDLHMDQAALLKKNKDKPKQDNLVILPELTNYIKSKQVQKNKEKKYSNPESKKVEQQINVFALEQNKFESCLFVKTERGPKKNNAFDQIDKYFWRKEHNMPSKRWIPNKRGLANDNQTLQPKVQNSLEITQKGKVDPLKQILKIFQEHNKQAMSQKKGRIIKISQLGGRKKQNQKKKL